MSAGLGGRNISLSLSTNDMTRFPAPVGEGKQKREMADHLPRNMGRQFLGGLCLQPPYSAAAFAGFCAEFAAVITETKVRRLKPVLKATLPSQRAKSVWSLPMPTFSPGQNLVPRCRTITLPPVMCSPPNNFTPKRLALESRPLRDEPPAFLCAMAYSLPAEIESTFTLVKCWRWPRLRWVFLRRFFLKAITFSPWPCSRISHSTDAPLTSGAPSLGVSPPSIKTSPKVSLEPTSPTRLSTLRTASLATRYCFPPVRTTAYMV